MNTLDLRNDVNAAVVDSPSILASHVLSLTARGAASDQKKYPSTF